MQQLTALWNALDPRRKMIVLIATIAMFASVLAVARMASTPSMALLYAGLESGAAGDVVAALEQRGVAYDIRGASIFVESPRRDELRMTLASEGLPASSSRGYELLDGLSGFGTTSQMFNAAYWRAKEGELARTIVAHPSITSARVHLANTESNPFQRDVTPSASVSVTTVAEGLAPRHAKALKFLVASAVAGLSPEDVSVIDGNGELIGAPEEAPVNASDDRSETLRQRVSRLLEARVGPGNAVVEVSIDTVTKTESLRERLIDPESRVAISIDTEERSNSASDQGGDVTVASNLPDGAADGNDSSSSQTSETRERVNYEISETERQVTMAPGAIKRMTVAVLVNGTRFIDDGGVAAFQPRDEEELSALRELVASAVGFDEARGDVITIKTMEFEQAEPAGSFAEDGFLTAFPVDLISLVQALVLGAVALVLGLFVVRPLLSKPPAPAPQLTAPAKPRDATKVEPSTVQALDGEIDTGEVDERTMSLISDGDMNNAAGLSLQAAFDSDMPDFNTVSADPAERLRNLIDGRREEAVELLRSWLETEEESV